MQIFPFEIWMVICVSVEAGRMTMETVSYSLSSAFSRRSSFVRQRTISDSLRLHQVITNLVGNAIKFTPSKASRKGHVAFSTRLLALDDQSVILEFYMTNTGQRQVELDFRHLLPSRRVDYSG